VRFLHLSHESHFVITKPQARFGHFRLELIQLIDEAILRAAASESSMPYSQNNPIEVRVDRFDCKPGVVQFVMSEYRDAGWNIDLHYKTADLNVHGRLTDKYVRLW
jgi:hypothetical protein